MVHVAAAAARNRRREIPGVLSDVSAVVFLMGVVRVLGVFTK
jgi:hypothetical protein